MDPWNPNTFDPTLVELLSCHSDQIANYYREAQHLMDEHLNSIPYQSLRPNRYALEHMALQENILMPQLKDRRIRVWHYTRLTDDEVVLIKEKLRPSTLTGLRQRLDHMVGKSSLLLEEADVIYRNSPFHSQADGRSGRIWTTTIPLSSDNHGVQPLLESWGGESAYFWLTDMCIAEKLKGLGKPRIVEIETDLRDGLNAYSVAGTVLQAWANHLGGFVQIEGTDLAITGSIETGRVLESHTLGDNTFAEVGRNYPEGCAELLNS